MPFARQVPAPPDVLALAARLGSSGAPGLAVLASQGRRHGAGWSFVAIDPDRRSARLDPLADDDLPATDDGWSHVPRWIGVVPYEARRSLERAGWTAPERRPPPRLVEPEWHRYRAVACIDHHEGAVFAVGLTAADADRLARRLEAPAAPAEAAGASVTDAEPPARHVERVAAAQELIRRGDLYQVNLARALRLTVARGADRGGLLTLWARLAAAAPAPFAALLELGEGVRVLSTSPELLLRAAPDPSAAGSPFARLLTAPIKGTRPRGADAAEDVGLALELDRDPKERAELAMIIDVERNDLGRVAVPGSVRILEGPLVVPHRTVHHREALLGAQVRPGVGREQVLEAMLPSGSVTGAPKVRAMEVIASLEPCRRGLYTGGLGFVAHDGGVTLAMAIRTAVLGADGEGEYLTGGGIVADSDPARELVETRWKAVQVERALSGPLGKPV